MKKMLSEIWSYREMVWGLVHRDLRGRYKGSALGFLWTFINPLLQLAVYSMVFSVILHSGIDKYYLHLFVALIPWIFFSTSVGPGCSCILQQAIQRWWISTLNADLTSLIPRTQEVICAVFSPAN